jgi:hypothetical protein
MAVTAERAPRRRRSGALTTVAVERMGAPYSTRHDDVGTSLERCCRAPHHATHGAVRARWGGVDGDGGGGRTAAALCFYWLKRAMHEQAGVVEELRRDGVGLGAATSAQCTVMLSVATSPEQSEAGRAEGEWGQVGILGASWRPRA